MRIYKSTSCTTINNITTILLWGIFRYFLRYSTYTYFLFFQKVFFSIALIRLFSHSYKINLLFRKTITYTIFSLHCKHD